MRKRMAYADACTGDIKDDLYAMADYFFSEFERRFGKEASPEILAGNVARNFAMIAARDLPNASESIQFFLKTGAEMLESGTSPFEENNQHAEH